MIDPRRGWFALLLLVPVGTLLAYGRILASGYLSDDFLFLAWAMDGWGELLARVTVDSYPQMIRPLSALVWPLALAGSGPAGSGGALGLHLLSLALHSANGVLVATIAQLRGASRGKALVAALLFVVFPLSTEAVCWLSSMPDLWATLGALSVIAIAARPKSGRRAFLAALVFCLALLSKETVLLLPAILLALYGKKAVGRLALGLTAISAGYLGLRFVLFDGLGGYLDASGHSLADSFSIAEFLRAALLQGPSRTLVAFKAPGALWPMLAAVTGLLVIALLVAYGRRGVFSRQAGRGTVAIGLALAPVAPIFSLGWDHEGSRWIYLPVALLCVVAGSLSLQRRRLGQLTAGLLGLWFLAATVRNVGSWVEASRRVESTMEAMASFQQTLPASSFVLVDTPSSFQGAYMFRNGLPEAARVRSLRGDVTWVRGTNARLPEQERERLGQTVFEIEPFDDGRWIDRTECARALSRMELDEDEGALSLKLPASEVPVASWFEALPIRRALNGPAVVVLHPPTCGGKEPVRGVLYWRTRDRARFTAGSGREFLLPAGYRGATPVRLPRDGEVSAIRIDLDQARRPSCWPRIELQQLPATCLPL